MMGCSQILSNKVYLVLMPHSLGDRRLLSSYSDMLGVSLKVGTNVPFEDIPEDHNLDIYHSEKLEHPDVILILR